MRAIDRISWTSVGYRNQLEQSERPEGPYITEFRSATEVHDLSHARYRESTDVAVYPAYKGSGGMVVADGVAMRLVAGHGVPGSSDMLVYAQERLALSPERLLLTARTAPDLAIAADTVLQGVLHHVVRFTLDGAPVTVYLNGDTGLPTAWDYSGPMAHRGFWNFLGDVTQRTYWNFWWLCSGGVRLPMQWEVEGNGLPDTTTSIRAVVINGPVDDQVFAIGADVRAAFRPLPGRFDLEALPLGDPQAPAVEIAPGIVQIPGNWNVTLVRQDDGIVVIEAPISSGYSAKVIAEARRRFPGLPIKAVVTTSDSWPHLAGIREYAAQGIAIYALDRNRPILERMLADPRRSKPDALSRAPRQPIFQWVGDRAAIGAGTNRIVLYPLRGETSERQMMAYFPQARLLYASDPFQRRADGSYFIPQTVSEVVAAVEREQIAVDRFFMMHVGPTAWSELSDALARARMDPDPSL